MKAARILAAHAALAHSLFVLTLAGCALQPVETVDVRKEVLNRIPSLPYRKANGMTVLILPVEAQPLYETTRIAYLEKPYRIGYFSRHEWAETPREMLQALLLRTLSGSGYFRAVVTAPYAGAYNFALRTHLLELAQDFTSEPAVVRLTVYCEVFDGATGHVRSTRSIMIREPVLQRDPESGVAAANIAAEKALEEIAQLLPRR